MVRVQLEALPESLQVAVLLSKLADFFLPVGDTEIKNLPPELSGYTAYVATVPYRFESVNPQTHFSIDTLNKRPSQYMVNECKVFYLLFTHVCSQLFSHFLCHALVYEPWMLCIVGFGLFMSEHKPVRSLRSYLVLSLWFLWWLTSHLWGFFKAINSVLGQNHTDKKNFVLSVRLILAADICISVLAVAIMLMRGKKRNSGLQILHTAFVCALVTWLIHFFILTAFYTSIQGDREYFERCLK